MNFIIEAHINPETDTEELLQLSERDLSQAQDFFESADVSDNLTLSVTRGSFLYPDGRAVSFENYRAKVASQFEQDGDRYWVTYDGGALNVSSLMANIQDAARAAREASE